jgi:RNA polymerase sigma factor (sigma-70 family)
VAKAKLRGLYYTPIPGAPKKVIAPIDLQDIAIIQSSKDARKVDDAFRRMLQRHRGIILEAVYSTHRRYREIDPQDIEQQANLTFLKAIRKFDPSMRCMVSTYTGEAMRLACGTWAMLQRFGRQEMVARGKIPKKTRHQMAAEGLFPPIPRMKLGSELVRNGPSGDEIPGPIESLESRPDKSIEDIENREVVDKLLLGLTDMQLTIIRGRFYEEKTLLQIGEEVGLTRERVRQIEKGALAFLRKRLERGNLDTVLKDKPKLPSPHFNSGDPVEVRRIYRMSDGVDVGALPTLADELGLTVSTVRTYITNKRPIKGELYWWKGIAFRQQYRRRTPKVAA